jgi:L-ascorbate metabolism protein UlaG (beta-lactamase superfamily)
MKITKLVHSCLLVEQPDRTALFDPGTMSEDAVNVDSLAFLDDIIITHSHQDHFSIDLIKALVKKFPAVRITAPSDVVKQLTDAGITASDQPSEGIVFFEAPHEIVDPMFPTPPEFGIHYLDRLTHPGDSHSFTETKKILALPVTAPWGTTVKAVDLGLTLKPKYIIPIHDWHWQAAAQEQTYNRLEQLFKEANITFIKAKNGEPFVLDV